LQEGREQPRHVIAGGVEREAKMAVEPRHFDRRNGTLSIRTFSFYYIASHIIDYYYIVRNLIGSSVTVNDCLRGHNQLRL
jgi:hypothetical protein